MFNSPTPGPFQSIQGYVSGVQRRLRLALASRGLGATVATALLLTVACVYVANRFAFSNSSVAGSRMILGGALIAVLVWVLIRPLLRLDRGRTAAQIEKSVPAFDGRVETLVDQTSASKGEQPNPLIDLLAEDAWRVAETAPTRYVVGIGRVFAYLGVAVAAFAFLFWLGHSGPGYWGYGTSELWAGWLEPGTSPLYQIVVEPGDTTIRQGADLLVAADTVGFEPPGMQLFAKFSSSVDWEQASMQRQLEGSGFEFVFAGVREPLRYYVTAGGIRSEEFEVNVVQMPHVEHIKLTYHYPGWTGMKPLIEDPGGDIRAVAGTEVEVEIETDKPLAEGILRVNGEESIRLEPDGLRTTGRLKVGQQGEYFVAAMYRGEIVRLTQDFFISVVPDEKPVVKFLRPGRDSKATSIEEVVTEFQARDDFGLRSFDLYYSVNGGEVRKEPLLDLRGRVESKAPYTFYLEEMGSDYGEDEAAGDERLSPVADLQPGDLVSYYAVARDAKTAVQTDMYFIEVRPFDLQFFQRQASGGGMMGSGGERNEISRRQKETLTATWNLIQESDNPDEQSKAEIRENALLLSEIQLKLRDQAQTLARRVKARQLAATDKDFEAFVENIEKAAEYMGPAGLLLKEQKLTESISPQQKALRHLRRAETIFRRIEISFGRGGAGGQGGRDLADMFELEMDLEKNQYETGGGSAQQVEREIDEALEKLRELAKRQEKLAERQRVSQAPTFSQRWQQEMLRREAEELRRRLEELQQRQQAAQRNSGQRSGQQSQGQSGQSQQQGGQQSQSQSQQQSGQQSGQQQSSRQGSGGAGSPRLESAIRNLQQAAQDMQASQSASGQQNSPLGQQQSQAYARRALDELEEALRKLADRRRQQAGNAISDIAKRAAQLTQQQKEIAARLNQALQDALQEIRKSGGAVRGRIPSGMPPSEELKLAKRKTEMQEEVEALEREIQQTARRMEDGEASRKLREALGDLQQSEVGTRLGNAARYIRQGYAVHIAQSEGGVTQALENLQQQIGEAERLAAAEGHGGEQGLERQLAQLEELRRRLEEAAGLGRQNGGEPGQGNQQGQDPRGAQRAEGQQPGSQTGSGQQGRRAGQQPGQGRQQGSPQGEGQSGRQSSQGAAQGDGQQQGLRPGQGERFSPGTREAQAFTQGRREGGPMQWRGSASNFGGRRVQGGVRAWDAGTLADVQRALREAVEQLPGLTQQLRRKGVDEQALAELRRFVAGLSQSRFPGNPQLLEKEHRKVLALLEQLELEVRRQVEQEKGNFQVRVIGAEPVPEQYREAVAEYFRRLSQGR